jgi:hypothetical protein
LSSHIKNLFFKGSSVVCVAIIGITSFTGCDTPLFGNGHYISASPFPIDKVTNIQGEGIADTLDSQLIDKAKRNFDEIDSVNKQERPWTHAHERPKLCLALSGGGIRSAAFSLGVMKGLSELRLKEGDSVLDRVNIVSATSGGAYALGWYYTQRKRFPAQDNTAILGAQLGPLSEKADFYTIPEYLLSGFTNTVLLFPPHLLFNFLPFGWHVNTAYASYLYEKKIKDNFLNGEALKLTELLDVMSNATHPIPFPVITTTSRIDVSRFHDDAILSNTVFEFTPLVFGNSGFLYHSSQKAPFNLPELLATSGAAPDSSQVISGTLRRTLTAVFNSDLGRYINNPNDERPWSQWLLTKMAPLPTYLFTESYNGDLRGSDIYLSDGGHQENLAAYPLIRRACETIIIVDAEHDPDYQFEGYFKLRSSLEKEMQANVQLFKTNLCNGKASCTDNDIDGIRGASLLNNERIARRSDIDTYNRYIPERFFSGRFPITKGRVGFFPIQDPTKSDGPITWIHSKLIYVKLSIDSRSFERWDEKTVEERKVIQARVGRQASDYYVSRRKQHDFPHHSTFYQSYEKQRFEAYIDLGTTMIKEHLDTSFVDGNPSNNAVT